MSKKYHRIYPAPGSFSDWLAKNEPEVAGSPVASATAFAAYLRISPATLMKWIKAGERYVPAYPIDSRRWAVLVSAAESWTSAILLNQRDWPATFPPSRGDAPVSAAATTSALVT